MSKGDEQQTMGGRSWTTPYDAPRARSDARPTAVVVWYRVYAAVMTLIAVGFLAFGILLAIGTTHPAVATRADASDTQLATLLILLVSTPLVVGHVFATLIPYRPWGWTVGLIVIGLGLPSCMVVVALPLLVHWLKPTTKAAFGRL